MSATPVALTETPTINPDTCYIVVSKRSVAMMRELGVGYSPSTSWQDFVNVVCAAMTQAHVVEDSVRLFDPPRVKITEHGEDVILGDMLVLFHIRSSDKWLLANCKLALNSPQRRQPWTLIMRSVDGITYPEAVELGWPHGR